MIERTVDHAIQLQRELDLPPKPFWPHFVMDWLLTCAARFKHPQWCGEQEFRLCKVGADGVQAFQAAGKDRVSVPFEPKALRRVIRGSKAGETVGQIECVLRENGYQNVPVVKPE